MTDLAVLNWQRVIPGHDWDVLKRSAETMERYIQNDARQHIAAKIAEQRLAIQTLSEPDSESDDPMRRTNAVLRLTVAVAAKDEAALLARELAEAENRGFRLAIKAISENLERFAPALGPTAYARSALDLLVRHVTTLWDHRPAADWRPMRTLPDDRHDIEFWFLTGEIGRTPRIRIPTKTMSGDAISGNVAVVECEEFDAIAWRYSGRPPHAGDRA